MDRFNEYQLEQAFIELFKEQGYDYVHGESIVRDTRDVVLYDDLRTFLRERYKTDGITENEISAAINYLESTEGGSVYAQNVEAIRLIMKGFAIKREDTSKPNLYINLIDYKDIKNNIFKFVNQLEIVENHNRIPDGIVFVNKQREHHDRERLRPTHRPLPTRYSEPIPL